MHWELYEWFEFQETGDVGVWLERERGERRFKGYDDQETAANCPL